MTKARALFFGTPAFAVRCLDALYRRRRIDLVHARVLRIWGERQSAPNAAYATERCDCRLWREALERLEWPLRVKGIVACTPEAIDCFVAGWPVRNEKRPRAASCQSSERLPLRHLPRHGPA